VLPEVVQEKLDALPSRPGVYVFRDRRGAVLYVGKASSLRNRVRSYFQPGTTDGRYFVGLLAREIGDLETFVAASEREAALLENQLIKEHQPRYNFKLRDDKEFLNLRLDPKAPWPRLEVVRRPRNDGARYFGPYHSATAARQTLRLVNRFFQLRTCRDSEFKARVRPCLQYQIKRCPGPCVLDVDRAEYGRQVDDVTMFLEGRHDELKRDLERRMAGASDALEYERAATFRDQIRAVDRVQEEQRVASARDVDQDVVGIFRQADQAEAALLMVRSGRLVGVRTFDLPGVSLPDDELVAGFVAQYYGGADPDDASPRAFIPDELLLPMPIEAMEGLSALLSEHRAAARGAKVRVLVPRRGPKAKLVEMARQNAEHAFREKARAKADVEERLEQVARKLRLPGPPHRIECVDVSHTAGDDTVAAVVALLDGQPDRARYRSFHVKRARRGDDYGAMYEVLSRRFRRGRDADAGWSLPDLLVVDGGKGQLGVARAALNDLGMTGLPVAALAKEKENVAGEMMVDRVYLPGQKNPIPVRGALQMLALARDEAHRASNTLRRKLGKRRAFQSPLEEIPGVGRKTRAALLESLGSLDAVKAADAATLVAAGASRPQAARIRRWFDGDRPAAAGPPGGSSDVRDDQKEPGGSSDVRSDRTEPGGSSDVRIDRPEPGGSSDVCIDRPEPGGSSDVRGDPTQTFEPDRLAVALSDEVDPQPETGTESDAEERALDNAFGPAPDA